MKILITSIVDLQNSQHNRPHQFIKHLSKKHDITVLSINDWWKASQGDLKAYSNDFNEVFKKVKIIHLTERRVSPILQEVMSLNKVKEVLREGFDVHLNYSTLATGYIASMKVNTVYDIADDLGAMIRSSPQIPNCLKFIGGAVGDFFIKKNISTARKITLTTPTLINTCRIPMDKPIEIIPNGVDVENFRDYGSNKKKDLGLEGFNIGYVGVLREWVDLRPVYLALKKLDSSIKLIVVGKEGKFNENIEMAKKYGIEDRIKFLGMVPYSQVPHYISAMDVCIIPFKNGAISENALPLKLFEYMACSKPVISAKLPGIERAAKDNILYANNIDEYKLQIYKLYNDDSLRMTMGAHGRQIVEANYNWSKIADQMDRVLMETATK